MMVAIVVDRGRASAQLAEFGALVRRQLWTIKDGTTVLSAITL